MQVSLLTYNVLFNNDNALNELERIIRAHEPDIICLQEVETKEDNLKKLEMLSYKIADYSHSFIKGATIFGLATLYNTKRLSFLRSHSLTLTRSLYEMLFTLFRLIKKSSVARTFLHTNFFIRQIKKRVNICNVHLSLYATNAERISQLRKILNVSKKYRNAFILTGDFNYYPYGRKNLERLMKEYRLDEATTNLRYTFTVSKKLDSYNFIQRIGAKLLGLRFIRRFFPNSFKIDYIFYKYLRVIKTQRLDCTLSDHYPILSTFEI